MTNLMGHNLATACLMSILCPSHLLFQGSFIETEPWHASLPFMPMHVQSRNVGKLTASPQRDSSQWINFPLFRLSGGYHLHSLSESSCVKLTINLSLTLSSVKLVMQSCIGFHSFPASCFLPSIVFPEIALPKETKQNKTEQNKTKKQHHASFCLSLCFLKNLSGDSLLNKWM